QNDPTVPVFLSRIGLPAAALTERYLFGVRDQAVARITETLARSVTTGGQIPAAVRPEQVIAALPAEFDRQALRSAAHLAAQHHIDQYLTTGLPTDTGIPTDTHTRADTHPPAGAGTPAGVGVSGVWSAGVFGAVEGGVWSQVERGVDAVLGVSAVLPAVVAGPDAGQVSAVARVVRQVVADLPARFSAA
ncbi:hypothetical protein, partial [Micromonospora olivasterospora]